MTQEQAPSMFSSDIKVSIIVPVFNVELYIKECLESLIHQTLTDIEIILIDDASTDGSGAICDEYALRDPRVRVVHHTQNVRQGKSRNEGISLARGEYIGFVDPDDWVDLDFYEKLYKAANKNQAQIAKGETIRWKSVDGKQQKSNLNKKIIRGLNKKKPLYILFDQEHWSAIYNTELIKKYNILYSSIRNSEDDVYLLKCCYFLDRLTIVRHVNYYYRIHPSSTFHKRDKEYYDSQLECFEQQICFLNENEVSEYAYKEIIIKYIARLSRLYTLMELNIVSDQYKKDYFENIIQMLFLLKLDPSWYLESFILGRNDNHFLNMLPYGRLKISILRLLKSRIFSLLKKYI